MGLLELLGGALGNICKKATWQDREECKGKTARWLQQRLQPIPWGILELGWSFGFVQNWGKEVRVLYHWIYQSLHVDCQSTPRKSRTLGKAGAFTGGQFPKRESVIITPGHWGNKFLGPEGGICVTHSCIHSKWQAFLVVSFFLPNSGHTRKLWYYVMLQTQE